MATLIQGIYKPLTTKAEQEALRAVEMVRHLPVAVSLTDMKGNVLDQNPEALAVFGSAPDAKEDTESTANSTSSSLGDKMDEETSDESGDDKAGVTTFIKRFVDQELGKSVLTDAGEKPGEVISIEALQQTVYGPKWSSVSVRQTKDPVTSKPILLYSARDISQVVEAKKQQAESSHAFKEMARGHVANAIRTPLQHVVGVVELLSRASTQCQCSSTPTQQQEPSCRPDGEDHATAPVPGGSDVSQLLQSAAHLLMSVIQDLMDSVGIADGSCICDGIINSSKIAGSSGKSLRCRHHDKDQIGPRRHNHRSSRPIRRRRAGRSSGSLSSLKINTMPPIVDVKQVLKGVLKEAKPHADVRRVSLLAKMRSKEPKDTFSLCIGDDSDLRHILSTLLHKAIKSTNTGGEVQVIVRRSRRTNKNTRVRYRFEVADNGSGLNLEQQKIFMNCGTVVDPNDVDGNELIRCKSIVEEMGGAIGVDSKPGCGSTFHFEIPFQVAPAGATAESQMKPTRSITSSLDTIKDEGGLHILLVDESNRGRKVMKALLEQYGHRICTADSGDEMISAVLEDEGFDVVLVETQLAKEGSKTALEATRELRQSGYSAEKLPILALTAASARADYYSLGLNDWLTKPMLIKNIQSAMTNAICNVGTAASSVGTASVFTSNDALLDNESKSVVSHGRRGPVSRQGSFGSVYSAFSKHLLAVSAPQPPKAPLRSSRSCHTSTTSGSISIWSALDASMVDM